MNQQTDINRHPGSEPQDHEGRIVTESITVPVIEEQLQVDKQVVEAGKVRIIKRVHEEEVTVDIPLVQDEIDVERVMVNQYVDTPPPPVRYEGDTMIIPVLREEIVVEKRLVLVEELRVTKRQVETKISQQVTLRREEVIVERSSSDPGASDAAPEIKIKPFNNQTI